MTLLVGSFSATFRSPFLILVVVASFALVPQVANAAKDHCRTITFTGVAGEGSQDTITIDIVEPDGAVINKACPMQVTSNQTNIEFLTNLSASWGQFDCPSLTPPALPPAEDLPVKKICANATAFGPSCRLKTKIKADKKNPGPPQEYKKKQVDICCYEEVDCKVKLGKNDISQVPISVRAQRNNGAPCPPDELLPAAAGTFCVVNLDPIGMKGLPSAKATSCRANIGKNSAKLMAGTMKTLTDCHKRRMAGQVLSTTDCNDLDDAITEVSDAAASGEASLRAAAAQCENNASPSRLGYVTCPAPCDHIDIGPCAQGLVGNTCNFDRECDTAPGALDGKCGNWTSAADCLVCLAHTAVETAVRDKYQTPELSLDSAEQDCQNDIGRLLAQLASRHYSETTACQKRLDGGKQDIPSTAKACKDADTRGIRAKANLGIPDHLQKSCGDATIAALDSICGGATTVAAAAQCIVENGSDLNDALSFAAYPDTIPPIPGDCPTSIEYEINAGNQGSCVADAQCIPGFCVSGSCVTRTDVDMGWTGLGHDMDLSQGSAFAVTIDCPQLCDANTANAGTPCTADSQCDAQCFPTGGGAPSGLCPNGQVDCGFGEACLGGCDNLEAPCGGCNVTGIDTGAGNCRCANDITASCDEPLAADIDDCGGALCECYLASPLPLSAAEVSTCSMRRIVSPITGAVDVDFGPVQLDIDLSTDVHLGISLDQPCPTCNAGVCNGGENNGLACATTSVNATFGALSLDCPPDPAGLISGSGIKVRSTNTTGTTTVGSPHSCDAPLGAFNCHCAVCSLDSTIACATNADCGGVAGTCTGSGIGASRQPNNCNDLNCTEGVPGSGDGTCLAGPTDLYCAGEVRHDGSGYINCASNTDCDVLGPGFGPCALTQQRKCFAPTITATGVPSPNSPVTVSTHCIAPTASAAVNASLGLPGPARVSMQMTPTIGCAIGSAVYEPEIGGCFAPKTVFVSSSTHSGALGGLAGADAQCNALASAAGLIGTFTAWLSDTSVDARSRVTHSPHPYLRTDGVLVANDWDDLIDGALAAPINLDENGAPAVGSNAVWSATDTDGTQAPGVSSATTCLDWTSNGATGPIALIGLRFATNADWTDCVATGGCGANDCNSTGQHLYCFED